MSIVLEPFRGQLPPEILNRLDTVVSGLSAEPSATPTVIQGVVPSARLVFITDASNADTITIGGHVFKFLTTLIAADTTTQVTRGVSAAATRASLVNAINGATDATVVPATTPFSASVVADLVSTSLRLRLASSRGGPAVAGTSPSITLAEALTPAASIWNCANLNVSGKTAASGQMISVGSVAVTAQMITAGSFNAELPFTPSAGSFVWTATSAAGVLLATTDTVLLSGNSVAVALAGGGAPALIATDVVSFFVTA